MFLSITVEEYIKPDLSGIFWTKMVAKNIVLGSPGTHFMHIRVKGLRAYLSTNKFDVICISENYLDSDTTDDDNNLKVAGCNLIRADISSNTKRGGVCIYYKYAFAFRLLNL